MKIRPVHIENIMEGKWYTILSGLDEYKEQDYESFELTGVPFQVKALNLPFVATYSPKAEFPIQSIDLRKFALIDVSDEYVRAFYQKIEEKKDIKNNLKVKPDKNNNNDKLESYQ